MARTTYTVVAGDTLTKIAKNHNTTVNELVRLNDLPDPNFIVVGQVLIVAGEATDDKVVVGVPVVDIFGLQTGTDRTIYAAWPSWDRANTEKYQVRWYWDNGDAIGWVRDVNSEVDNRQSIYSGAPQSAKRVRFVMRPVAKQNEDETVPWTSPWSEEKIYMFEDNPPLTPPTPSEITIDKNCWMEIKLSDLSVGNANMIEFQIAKISGAESYIFHTGKSSITTSVNMVTYGCYVSPGCMYKVRCRSVRGTIASAWSNFSSEFGSIPEAPARITTCRGETATSAYLKWSAVDSATSYDIQYTSDKNNFDKSSDVYEDKDIQSTERIVTGNIESGKTYFFRVRAKNNAGESGWSEIASTAIGAKPTSPTTWSSKTTAVIGEIVTLHWAHNVEDGSEQTGYMLELNINGTIDPPIVYETSDEFYDIDTNELANEDSTITWRVKTKGITGEYCDEWSVARVIKVYVQPTLSLAVIDSESNMIEKLRSFPFYISGSTSPATQKPIGYHVSVTANESYNTVDNLGNEIFIKRGEVVYSEYFDTSEQLRVEISANNITLENNVYYTIIVVVSFDSGLTAEATYGSYQEFQVAWTSEQYVPNASINVDKSSLTASIRPYCEDSQGNVVTDAYVSIYRRDFDGRFTEIAKNVDCANNIFVTDPHPALDYARYRIVAKSKSTGSVTYYDMPGVIVGEKAAIIQWDERWSSFESMTEKESSNQPWSGSLIKFPYNIDVSSKHQPDVSHVEYIGREHPVSYHGTQTGESYTWNTDIIKGDKEMLYSLRRLSIWRGNVYVREPSGSGYWATVTVSFGEKHKELTIPVTINITRVEGGV